MIIAANRHAQVNVNLGAIKQNVKQQIESFDSNVEVFGVVKANGYGHGMVPVAQAVLQAGAKGLCVAMIDEAIELRRQGILCPILVLGIQEPSLALLAAEYDISLPVGDLDWLQQAASYLKSSQQLKIHLAVDSGMGRIGFMDASQMPEIESYLMNHQANFEVEGLFTHFATADEADDTYFNYQVSRFNAVKKELSLKPKYIHMTNSATSLFHHDVHGNMVRIGIGLYGLNPSSSPSAPDLALPYTLTPALSLTSELVFVKEITPEMGVSYGATYKADENQWIGTIPVGYADGWSRKMQGFKVKVGDEYCPVVGRVCMDQFMVKLSKPHPVGTKVTLISDDPSEPNSVTKVANYLDTIHYEVICGLTPRLKRVYHNSIESE
ncbi:alanine racemase [Holzapfeliella sp. JNUCC 80]